MEYCVKIFGKGRVAGEIIAGLEPPASTQAAIEFFAKRGIVSTICVFRPCVGTDLQHRYPPPPEQMIDVMRTMYEACVRFRIPVGIAPNIKVSLTMLPEEGRYFFKGPAFRHAIVRAQWGLLRRLYRAYCRMRINPA